MIILDTRNYKQRDPKHLPSWKRLLDSLTNQLELTKSKFMLMDNWSTPSVKAVRAVLDQVDEPVLLSDMDPFDLHAQYMLPIGIRLGRSINPVLKAETSKNQFVKGQQTVEYLLPTNGLVGPGKLTVYDDWEDWAFVNPLRMFNHNSLELDLELTQAQARFGRDAPSIAVYGLDTVALLIKYIKYLKNNGDDYGTVDRDLFVAEEVLPRILDDMLDVWCVNFIEKIVEAYLTGEEDEIALVIESVARANMFVGKSTLANAAKELMELIDKVASSKITIGGFIESPLLPARPLSALMDEHVDDYVWSEVPALQGYELLKSASLITLMSDLIGSVKDNGRLTKLKRDIDREYDRMERASWAGRMRNPNGSMVAQFALMSMGTLL